MSTPQKSRLTWSRQPNETGLARVCQAERGKDLKYNGKRIAYVRPLCDGFHRKTVGYYWVARADELKIELRNTCDTPVLTIEEAQAQCVAYVRTCLAKSD